MPKGTGRPRKRPQKEALEIAKSIKDKDKRAEAMERVRASGRSDEASRETGRMLDENTADRMKMKRVKELLGKVSERRGRQKTRRSLMESDKP